MQLFKRKLSSPYISEADGDDIAHIASLHGENFVRGWNKNELSKMLAHDHTFCLVLRPEGKLQEPPLGFVICRRILDEAEILSIATSKKHRHIGVARHLLDETIRRLQSERKKSLFLEVDENNANAIALYKKTGFRLAGAREGYYHSASRDGEAKTSSALVMHLEL